MTSVASRVATGSPVSSAWLLTPRLYYLLFSAKLSLEPKLQRLLVEMAVAVMEIAAAELMLSYRGAKGGLQLSISARQIILG